VAAARILLAFGLLALAVWAARLPWPRELLAAREGMQLTTARTWGLQLQNVAALAIPEAIDILVVDYSRDGSDARAWSPATVEALRRRESGRPRIVLCYLSIGEAESYRYYWHERWWTNAHLWLGRENPEWKGNYAVRYWDPGWQRIIVHAAPNGFARIAELIQPHRKPYLDRIMEAGFDGVYLDRIDAFAEWEKTRGKQSESDMVEFVRRISAYAKKRRPGFLIVPQNGEELLKHDSYLAAIDAAAKEDLLFGIGGDEIANDPGAVTATEKLLDRVKKAKKPVLVVEYLADATRRGAAVRDIAARGYIPLVAARALNTAPLEPSAFSAFPTAADGKVPVRAR